MHTLSRTETVLDQITIVPSVGRVIFQQTLDEPGEPRTASFSLADWHDMGDPETVTVTIVPGNTLN